MEENQTPRTDYYDVLNIARHSTKTQIREAYIRLKNTFSNQSQVLYSLMSDEESQEMLRQVEEAFNVLKDDSKRRRYDAQMGWSTPDEDAPGVYSPFQSPAAHVLRGEEPALSGHHDEDFASLAPHSPVTIPPKVRIGNPRANVVAPASGDDGVRRKMQTLIDGGEITDGELFKQLREVAGVGESEIQDRTKITLEYIRAIEANNFKVLPPKVFVKGFVRSYLRYLKVPGLELMVEAYMTRYDAWQQGGKPTSTTA